jgi:hypothetical protein
MPETIDDFQIIQTQYSMVTSDLMNKQTIPKFICSMFINPVFSFLLIIDTR